MLWKQESFLVQVPLVELVELLAGHRGHGSVRVLVETVQGNMLSYKSSFHEALNYDAEAAAWQRLHNDCNSCRSRFDRDVLGRLSGELLKVFEGDSSEPLAALINNFLECRKGFRKCAHRQLFNYTLRAEFFRNLLNVPEKCACFPRPRNPPSSEYDCRRRGTGSHARAQVADLTENSERTQSAVNPAGSVTARRAQRRLMYAPCCRHPIYIRTRRKRCGRIRNQRA